MKYCLNSRFSSITFLNFCCSYFPKTDYLFQISIGFMELWNKIIGFSEIFGNVSRDRNLEFWYETNQFCCNCGNRIYMQNLIGFSDFFKTSDRIVGSAPPPPPPPTHPTHLQDFPSITRSNRLRSNRVTSCNWISSNILLQWLIVVLNNSLMFTNLFQRNCWKDAEDVTKQGEEWSVTWYLRWAMHEQCSGGGGGGGRDLGKPNISDLVYCLLSNQEKYKVT